MNKYSLVHLNDSALIRELAEFAGHERGATAGLLARIAEVDARKLFLPAAYPHMHAYYVHELHLSEDAAYKRIQAARASRRFPFLFDVLADGRVHLSGICLLAPHLIEANAESLISAAVHKTKAQIERMLAERFARTELMPMIEVIPSTSHGESSLAPGQVKSADPVTTATCDTSLAPGQVERVLPPARVQPIAPQRFALDLSFGQETHDLLRHVQDLLGHQVPAGDVVQIFHRALQSLSREVENDKFAATGRPQLRLRQTRSARHIPAHVKRAVRERDGDRCAFMAENGRRCASRTRLEFDHIEEVARGGEATEANVRLRCRAHNRFTAEGTFGREFMTRKIEDARGRRPA